VFVVVLSTAMVSSMPTTTPARQSEGYIILFGLNERHMLPKTLQDVAMLLCYRYTILLSEIIFNGI